MHYRNYATLGCGTVVFAAITIFAPSCAALSAIAFPIPREAPVMNNVLPLRDILRVDGPYKYALS